MNHELMKLMADDVATYVGMGCNPTCHACGRNLVVGDEYGFSESGVEVLQSAERVVLRAMTCSTCFSTGKFISDMERDRLLHRLSTNPAFRDHTFLWRGQKIDPHAPRQSEPGPLRAGCFMVGTAILP